jgi:hemerythrin-like domain-containing protein
MEEHRNIERMLALLQSHAERMEAGKAPDADFFHAALRFIREYADACHHGKEENLLFTMMIDRGFPRESGPIAMMLYEHELGREHVRGMQGALDAVEAGDASAAEALAQHAFGYADLLRNHIYKEDNMLFRMADEHLSPGDQQKLLERFEELHASGDACAGRTELLGVLAQLEATAG